MERCDPEQAERQRLVLPSLSLFPASSWKSLIPADGNRVDGRYAASRPGLYSISQASVPPRPPLLLDPDEGAPRRLWRGMYSETPRQIESGP